MRVTQLFAALPTGPSRMLPGLFALLGLLAGPPAFGATYTVTTTADSGPGSLR
jgi:hypothetical protein